MSRAMHAVVHLGDGSRGVADREALERQSPAVVVRLGDGRTLEAPASAFRPRPDGDFLLNVAPPPAEAAPGAEAGRVEGEELVIPVAVEEAEITTREVVTGAVRVTKTVRTRQEVVDLPLTRDEVEVVRVPVGRMLESPGEAEVRREGDTTIVPVVEEVLVVEKRLRLREEVRITRKQVQAQHAEAVSLRVEEAEVRRVPVASVASDGSTARQLPDV